jgi:tetratricopeptide (TPR) repeat protein
MEELCLQQDEEYGSMLRALGGLDLEQERYKEALAIYYKAQAVLVGHKEGNAYGALLNDIAVCYVALQQWSEAVACYKEGVELDRKLRGNNHPEYATGQYNLADVPQAVRRGHPAIRACSCYLQEGVW